MARDHATAAGGAGRRGPLDRRSRWGGRRCRAGEVLQPGAVGGARRAGVRSALRPCGDVAAPARRRRDHRRRGRQGELAGHDGPAAGRRGDGRQQESGGETHGETGDIPRAEAWSRPRAGFADGVQRWRRRGARRRGRGVCESGHGPNSSSSIGREQVFVTSGHVTAVAGAGGAPVRCSGCRGGKWGVCWGSLVCSVGRCGVAWGHATSAAQRNLRMQSR